MNRNTNGFSRRVPSRRPGHDMPTPLFRSVFPASTAPKKINTRQPGRIERRISMTAKRRECLGKHSLQNVLDVPLLFVKMSHILMRHDRNPFLLCMNRLTPTTHSITAISIKASVKSLPALSGTRHPAVGRLYCSNNGLVVFDGISGHHGGGRC